MVIEPLSSAMSNQAQTGSQTKPMLQKQVAENTDVATEDQQVNAYDAATVKVAEAGKQDNRGRQELPVNDASKETQILNEQLKKAVEKMNQTLSHSEAIFGIHEGTNRLTIKIVDKDTKEIIKEVPPEKTLDMIAKVWELAGILVDERG